MNNNICYLKKMMVRLFLFLILLSCLSFSVHADTEYQDGDYRFIISQGKITITGYDGNNEKITVPSKLTFYGKKYPVKEINGEVFLWNHTIESVILPDTIVYIGQSCFAGCENLRYVELPNKLQGIPNNCFADCKNLSTVIMPTCEIVVGFKAFENCKNLSTIEVGNITSANDYAFWNTSLTSISMPKCYYIGKGAFASCELLKEAILGNKLSSISNNAFAYCSSLEKVDLGIRINEIDYCAFKECGLLEVTVPASVKHVGKKIFENCVFLKNVNYYAEDISEECFKGCTSLEKISIGEEVECIYQKAFVDTASLRSVSVPQNTRVMEDAFYGAPILTKIYGYIGSSAQYYANENQITFIPLKKVLKNQKISVTKQSYNIPISSSININAKSGSGQLSYTSENKKIARVSSTGKVKALAFGYTTIIITAPQTDKYKKATIQVKIYVCPKKNIITNISKKNKSLVVKWKRDKKAKGYILQYSQTKGFKNPKTVTIKKNSTVSKTIK